MLPLTETGRLLPRSVPGHPDGVAVFVDTTVGMLVRVLVDVGGGEFVGVAVRAMLGVRVAVAASVFVGVGLLVAVAAVGVALPVWLMWSVKLPLAVPYPSTTMTTL